MGNEELNQPNQGPYQQQPQQPTYQQPPPGYQQMPPQYYQQPAPKPKRKRGLIIGVIAIVAIIIVILLVVLAVRPGGNDGGSALIGPKPNLQVVSSTYSQSVLGATTVTVKVTNTGDAIGSKNIHVDITEGQNTYRQTQDVSLAPGETTSYSLKVSTPFGTAVTSGMIRVYLSST
jgi:preprotein translocase subunit SecG